MGYKFNPFTGTFDSVGQSIGALNVKGSVADVASLPGGATVGDVYFVQADLHFYVWDGAAWDDLGTLQGATGPAGADGKTILNGSGAPSAGLGSDDDFYLDTASIEIYGPKTAGAWGAGTSLVGPTGATGPAGTDGAGVIAGGTTGQALVKASNTDYDTQWSDVATGGTPGGTTGQLQWNSSGSFAGVGGSTVGATGDITLSLNGAASTPPLKLTGTWFSGGTATTTKPQFLIEPAGTTSTTWSTSGTGLGVNAPSGFAGNLLDLQVDGESYFYSRPGQTLLAFNLFAGYKTGVSLKQSVYTYKMQALSTSGTDAASGLLFTISGCAIPAGNPLSFSSDNAGNAYTGGYLVGVGTGLGILEQRGTSAQTYRLYNTYTNASNYERAYLRWASNVLEIGTEGAGTGSEQPVRITAATLKLPNLPTYADNTAATSGGLVAGDVYKTATGELRITV